VFFAALMVVSIAGVTTFRAYLYPHAGGFTTEEQKRLTRSEVVDSEILTTQDLILKGQPQEAHLLELLTEKAELKKQKMQSRLEVLNGGIAHVRKLISNGEQQEGHLRELLAEQVQLEKQLSNFGTAFPAPSEELQNILAKINAQKIEARLEVLRGGIAHVRELISHGEHQEIHLRELLAEQTQLRNELLKIGGSNVTDNKHDVITAHSTTDSPSTAITAPHNDSVLDKSTTSVDSNPASENLQVHKDELLYELFIQISKGIFPRISSLVVDRWVGVEGVMAVSSYPNKNSNLLMEAMTEKRVIGKATKFQEICNSQYRWIDASNWQFASLPGAAAFLYLSGSLWVVLFGMLFFVFIMQLFEQIAFAATFNPLLCSLFGLTMANTISQFGVTPRQDLPFYVMLFSFVLVVYLVQSDKIARLRQNFTGA
jgi:hypothetical protein